MIDKMKKLLCILFFVSKAIFASPYPIITSVDVEYNSKGADYTFTQKVVDIGSAGDYKVTSMWYSGLGHKHVMPSGEVVGMLVTPFAHASGYDTISKIMMDQYNSGQKNINIIHHTGENGFPECVGYFAGPVSMASSNTTTWSRTVTPGGCLIIPPANEWCKITTPEIILEHGTITLKEAEGSVAQSSVGVSCTTPTAVTFNLITQDKYVYLDEGKSEITVGEQPLDTKIDLPQGDSQVEVKDLLTGVNTEGFHTGSSVLVMMPY